VTDRPLRIVSLNAFLPGYRLVADWAARHGHELVLVVTLPPSAADRYGGSANPLVVQLPETQNVLVTGKLRGIAAPVIDSLHPDLVISAAFPRLIPPEILDLPKFGAINCHPSPLPAGRGPNPARLIYEGDDRVAASVHRTAAGFDTGNILAQRSRPLPEDLNGPALLNAWRELLSECLDAAVPRAVAGEPGAWQNPAEATEAPFFTPEEHLLDLTEPADVIRRKTAALNITSPQALARIPGIGVRTVIATYAVPSRRADPRPDPQSTEQSRVNADPGSVLETHADGWTVQTADRPLRLHCGSA
jgi:methionyl-tRNA formyltransferase